MVLCSIALHANVVTGTCGDNLTWSYDTETKALTIEGTGDMYDYGYNGAPWTQVNVDILSVSLPEGLTSIGSYAFSDCKALTSFIIPDGVTSIGRSAFNWCTSLTSVTIPHSVTSIGGEAFLNCPLISVTIPNSVTSIGGEAFNLCSQVIVECTTPFIIGSRTFNTSASIFVPCSAFDTYLQAQVWGFLNLKGLSHIVNLSATKGGKATITATDCDANTATIEATSDECMHFVQWSDGNTDNPRTLNLTQDTTLVAQFESTTYQVNIFTGENGFLRVNNYWDYLETDTFSVEMTDCGNELTTNQICAVPDEGYYFAGWSDGSTEQCRTFTITQDTTVAALFEEIKYYSVTLRGRDLYGYYEYTNSWGDISNAWFDDRTEISFTIESGLSVRITEEGYCGTWLGWSDGNTEKNSRTITITSDTVITSLFDVPTYQVNISTAANGSLTQYGEPIGNIETTMTDCDSDGEWINNICAVPDDGYYFTGWSDGYADACRSIEVVSDTTLIAHFAEKQQVQVLVGVEPACKNLGTVSGSGTFYQGDVVTITATPNSGYHFVEWSDGNSIANREIVLASDTTLFATFAAGDMGGKCGDNLYWTWDNGALTITGTGDMDLKNHPAWWQYDNLLITSVSMPEGMTSISSYAFEGHPIATIIVPASVEEVGDGAFADNDQLTHFEYLGNNIHWGTEDWYWDNRPLNSCNNLQYFRGNKDLLYWEDIYASLDIVIISNGEAWGYWHSATYVDNINATDKIIRGGDDDVKAVKTLYLPAGLVEIGDYALQNARFLGGITIPAGVTRIGISAFEDCRSMDSVIFAGHNVETIGDWAFYNCHSLRSLTLPEGVEEIGRAAFFDCTYLNELTLPSTMKKIADNGFAGCEKLGTMYVNALVPPTIEAKTFEDVDRATTVFVPKGTIARYQADQYWSEFFNMAEYEAPTGNLNTAADNDANALRKVLRNGQVLILRGDKTYTILGEAL